MIEHKPKFINFREDRPSVDVTHIKAIISRSEQNIRNTYHTTSRTGSPWVYSGHGVTSDSSKKSFQKGPFVVMELQINKKHPAYNPKEI